jgi:DNA-binding transcriptional ArsR family regulator
VARRLNISPAAASQHTTVLRNAGLLVSHRDRNTVLHTLTPLGRAMLNS